MTYCATDYILRGKALKAHLSQRASRRSFRQPLGARPRFRSLPKVEPDASTVRPGGWLACRLIGAAISS